MTVRDDYEDARALGFRRAGALRLAWVGVHVRRRLRRDRRAEVARRLEQRRPIS